jgi:single-strand DNA-binding protein
VCNQYLVKGARVYVEGRLQTRQWQDQDGQTRYSTEVIASDMIMLDSRREMAEPLEETDVVVAQASSARPAAPAAVAPAVSTSSHSAKSPNGARAARVTALPRGKAAFEEEDLPF